MSEETKKVISKLQEKILSDEVTFLKYLIDCTENIVEDEYWKNVFTLLFCNFSSSEQKSHRGLSRSTESNTVTSERVWNLERKMPKL